ncbi:MAG: Omp28 family outer membrane lipoprotein [Candidatus Kapaibacterium sp.]
MKKIILFLALGLFAVSCDIVDEPYLQNEKTIGDFKKKVILLDFTAINCVYCPNANKVSSDLAKAYGEENVILFGAHASTLADPKKPEDVDMRSETSAELFSKFATPTTGLPIGMVNQKLRDGVRLMNFGLWDKQIIDESFLEPDLDLDMQLSYNETDSTVSITVNCDYINKGTGDDNLCIYITEDSIVSPQKNNTEVIKDYVHNHVLRGSVTGTFGEQLKSGGAVAGENITKEYTYKIPVGFRHNKLRFVAFVQDVKSYYIKQATAEHLYE